METAVQRHTGNCANRPACLAAPTRLLLLLLFLRQVVDPLVIVDVLYFVVVIAYQPWGTLEQRFL